jgi:hypothetical protein
MKHVGSPPRSVSYGVKRCAYRRQILAPINSIGFRLQIVPLTGGLYPRGCTRCQRSLNSMLSKKAVADTTLSSLIVKNQA